MAETPRVGDVILDAKSMTPYEVVESDDGEQVRAERFGGRTRSFHLRNLELIDHDGLWQEVKRP